MADTPPQTYRLADLCLTRALDLREVFGTAPRTLEVDVGCGKGRFLTARARANPSAHFLGIDRSRSRILRLDKRLQREGIANVRLILLEASYVIERLIPPASVSTFHVFFPDPWPKRRHHRRRLFTRRVLDALHAGLRPAGQVNFATDYLDYFEETCRLFRQHPGFTEIPAFVPSEAERTNFEVLFMGKNMPIGRASFRKTPLPQAAPAP